MAINRIKTGGITDGTIQSGDLAPGNIANDRLANNTITINGTSIALGASGDIVAGTDWQAVTVADGSTTVNTVAGGGYLLDTNAGVIEAFLPTSPSRGDTVVIADYSGTFATNKCIVNTGGENIDSTVGTDFQLTTNNTIAEFIYIDSSKGWLVKLNQAAGTTPSSVLTDGVYDTNAQYISATGGTVTESGDFKIHAFTGDGCFVVSCGGNPAGSDTVDYLVVAGGGGAGVGGGGGGAGGLRIASCFSISAQTYPITVGAGGSGGNICTGRGFDGSNSVFSTITSTGGGAGGGCGQSGNTGGSGGGGARTSGPAGTGAAGNTPPVSPPQGNPGGNGANLPVGFTGGGGGGGGASAAGGNACSSGSPGPGSGTAIGGDGGNGTNVSPTFGTAPQPFYIANVPDTGPTAAGIFAGGGGGKADDRGASFTPGKGGDGGGGDANPGPTPSPGNNGVTNSGGGGGSGSCATHGSGGKGIVIIRYKFQ